MKTEDTKLTIVVDQYTIQIDAYGNVTISNDGEGVVIGHDSMSMIFDAAHQGVDVMRRICQFKHDEFPVGDS